MRIWLVQALALLGAAIGTGIGEEPSTSSGVSPALVQQAISAFYKEHPELPRDGSGPWIELIGKAGGPEELRKLFAQAAAEGFTIEATVRALDALSEGASRSVRPSPNGEASQPIVDPDCQALTRFLFAPDARLQAAAARLAGAWKMEDAANRLGQLATSSDAAVRLAAFEALRAIGGKTAMTFFAVLARPGQSPEMRRKALVAIAEINLDAAVVQAVEVLSLIDNEADALETWRGLLKVDRAANSFAVRLPKGLPAPVLTAGIKAARELGKAGEPLIKVLAAQIAASQAGGKPR